MTITWIIAHGMLKTCDLVQRTSLSGCLSPHWSVKCKDDAETANHVFLHCPIAMTLCQRLFLEANVSLAAPASCRALLSKRYKFFGEKNKGLALGG